MLWKAQRLKIFSFKGSEVMFEVLNSTIDKQRQKAEILQVLKDDQ